jgi:hypothetical protein
MQRCVSLGILCILRDKTGGFDVVNIVLIEDSFFFLQSSEAGIEINE